MLPFLHIGGAAIPTYGLVVTLGYAVGTWWVFKQLKHIRGEPGEFWALAYTLIFFAVLGGRLGFYLTEWRAMTESGVSYNWRTGWVFLPGFLSALLGGRIFQFFYNRSRRPRRYLQVADYFTPALALGHSIGRLACFLQGCCYGAATDWPWGIRFTAAASSVHERLMGVPLHPTQLLEAGGSLLIFLLLSRHVLPGIRAKKYAYGASFFGYLGLYAAMRFVLEFLRGDDRGFLLCAWLSPSQWLSLGVLAAAAWGLWANGLYERRPKGRTIYLR